MQVRKRNGQLEEVKLEKITHSVARVCVGLEGVDSGKIAFKTVGGIYEGITTRELDELSIRTAVSFISEDTIYSKVAARLMSNYIAKEVEGQEIYSFSQAIQVGYENGLINDETFHFVMNNKRKLNAAIKPEKDDLFEYYGIRVVYDRYLLKHPTSRKVFETPQYFFLRVACGLTSNVQEAIEYYGLISQHEVMSSTPTLFNSGTRHPQMSSCYLLDSPLDDLQDIEKRRRDIAMLSKWAGGIGLSYSRVRPSGSLIKGTNGKSNGIVPFIHSLDGNVAAVNQGGKRKGAACVYLDTWHADIMEFLELRDNTGDKEKRAHNLNLANWVPDIFMRRVEADEMWSLLDPSRYPELPDLFGEEFERRYLEIESQGGFVRQIRARDLYARMMRTLAETGNGWMCFKDTSNKRGNTAVNGSVIHSSNLCTEILEPTHAGNYKALPTSTSVEALKTRDYTIPVLSHMDMKTGEFVGMTDGEVAVCNLASLNVGKGYLKNGKLDITKLHKNVDITVKMLANVIDRNYYPVPEAHNSNKRWRPVGLGLMGLQDLFFQMRLPFESPEAIALSAQIQEEIYYQALKTSCELAKQFGPHDDFEHTHAAKGLLQFDLAGNDAPNSQKRWQDLKADIKTHGLRNSLLIAIAPTVTIAGITGATECIEPQVSNMFKRETLSGEFVSVNRFLVEDLKKLGLWTESVRQALKANEGSIQNIASIPADIKALYKTAWEISPKVLIQHAVGRGCFIDQSQSLNLFMESASIEKLSAMYFFAWKQGIKTTYYLRTRAATKIQKVTVGSSEPVVTGAPENVEICESCT